MDWNDKKLIELLKEGGVCVMPTDTIYGVVGRAESELTVNRIYALRKRNEVKPCIILIGSIEELTKFNITLTEVQKNIIEKYIEPTSFILDCSLEKFAYLHCGTKTLAFRIPALAPLRNLLLQTGPLIAPSANTEALPPSNNIADAKKYFGDAVDLYVDGGQVVSRASRVIRLHKDGRVDIIRQ